MLKRAKSDMLPLKTVPNPYQTQRLVLTMAPDVETFGNSQQNAFRDADFGGALCAETRLGQDMGLEEAADIEKRLRRLVEEWTEMTVGQRIGVDINMGALLKEKTAAA